MRKHVPSKTTKGKRHLPWIDYDIKRKMRKRDRLFVKARRSKNQHDWATFRSYRNKVTKLVRNAHTRYINEVVGGSLKDNPKSFWSYVKLMRTENTGIPPLKSEGKLCTTDSDKAQALNNQFKSVFNIEDPSSIPSKSASQYPTIDNLTIGVEGVAKQFANLNPNKACGPDEIPAKLLKTVSLEIAPAMQFLFQQSYDLGIMPEDWSKALVTALYKKGPKSDPGNYRPISLTCLSCKIMEHVVLSHIAKHLSHNNILLDSQHGFREKLSTVTQLINSTYDWASTLNHRGQTDLILLDFSKAFDLVPHHRLAVKLEHYGINGPTLRWIQSFLRGRQQAVSVNGSHSSWQDVTSGVPQGSVLGPTLFLLYINDISDHLKSPIRLFADDSIIYREISSPMDHVILQDDLTTLATWADTWLMRFNVGKCAVMSITLKKKPSLHEYNIRGEVLNRAKEHDYLGVTISDDLKWTTHCRKTTTKASRTLGMLRRTLSACSKEVKSRAYLSLVRPQLEYSGEAWSPYTQNDINRLEQVQRQAARFVHSDYRKTTHVTPLLQDLDWDTLHHRCLGSYVLQNTVQTCLHPVTTLFPALNFILS